MKATMRKASSKKGGYKMTGGHKGSKSTNYSGAMKKGAKKSKGY